MLIEFSVSNFRSFRASQTLSMAAVSRLHKKENTFKPEVDGETLPALLKVVAIYGPNASGKSNLIKALDAVSTLARSAASEGGLYFITPFRFDPALQNEPSTFELHFVASRMRYQFNLAATKDRILRETLIAYPRGREMLLYDRQFKHDRDEYIFGDGLQGGREIHEAWRLLTSPKVLFLNQAVANSNEELQQLRPALHWLKNGMSCVDRLPEWTEATQRLVHDNPALANSIAEFLHDMDVPVTGFRVDSVPLNRLAMIGGKTKDVLAKGILRTTFTHKTLLGEAEFTLDEESDGTKGLFGFWLPWYVMATSSDTDHVLAIDEFDSSLHPHIVANLVERHLGQKNPAQLIFTTHDTHLMDTKLLRRDQFWLTERDKYGATVLRSIYEFSGREGEDVEKRYHEGRYRGLPLVKRS